MPLSSLPGVTDLVRWSSVSRRLRTVGLAFLVVVDVAFTATAFDARQKHAAGLSVGPGGQLGDVGGLLSILGIALAVGVIWRHRWPVAMAAVGSVVTIVAQLGPTFALIGLMTVVTTRPPVVAWRVGALVGLATGVAMWRDLMATPLSMSFWGTLLPLGSAVPWWVPMFLTAAVVGGFVGVGLWLRTRAQLRTAETVVAAEREVVTALSDEVSRQTERERLAREIHDGLGHNLSILSVHAGALQAMAESVASEADDPDDAKQDDRAVAGAAGAAGEQMRESAKVVRDTAARSVAELHNLLSILRNPDDPDVAAPRKTLRDVRALVDDSVTAGMPLVATVFVDDGQAIDPHIAEAAYRIVQELLTNARKHAPTVSVRLSVTGSPAEGSLVIATANHVPPGSRGPSAAEGARAARAGTGLVGIRERLTHLGGEMTCGLDDSGVFRVSVRLPWIQTDAVGGEGYS